MALTSPKGVPYRQGTGLVGTLTEREREVLSLLMDGGSNAAVAAVLGISPHTVRTHVHRVFTKMGVHSRVEAAAVAAVEGLTSYSTSVTATTVELRALRLLVVGDPAPVSGRLQAALRNADMDLLAHVLDADHAVTAVERYRPDLVLVEDTRPGAPAALALCAAVKERPDPRRLVVLAERDDDTLLRALIAGADGYAAGFLGTGDVLNVIRRVDAGELVVPDDMRDALLRGLVSHAQQVGRAIGGLMCLTPRERQVVGLLARGGDRRSVADALAVSVDTARTHIQHVLAKLGVRSQLEAVALATRLGIAEHVDSRQRIRRATTSGR